MLTRREFGLTMAAWQRPRPNLLFVLASGLGRGSAPAFLARDSVEYTRAYAVNPAAAPSRAALQTGKYPHQVGAAWSGSEMARDAAGIASRFTKAGYRTGYVGSPERTDLRRLGYGYVAEGGDAGLAAAFMRGSLPFFLFETLDSAVEQGLGRLFRTMAELRLTDDTIVVFTSDHGEGESWAEQSTGVPVTIRWPRALRAGERRSQAFCTVNLPSVLAGLCGVSGLETWEYAESVYLQGQLGTDAEWRAVVRGWDKLVVNRTLQATHLFNLAQDPAEMENLAEGRATLRRQEELMALMRHWIVKTGDRVPYPGRAPNQERR